MHKAKKMVVDWGSSSYRAFLLDEADNTIAQAKSDDGILTGNNKDFSQILSDTCTLWGEDFETLPMILGGMIGSRSGWVETDYVACPASLDDLARALVSVEGARNKSIRIIPGISGTGLFGSPDVMRGEETQVFGALDMQSHDDAIVCLPGTHSKWCIVEGGKITSLTTFMTGEMYGLMRGSSSIGALAQDNDFDQPSFLEGVTAGQSDAGLLNKLFGIRADALLGNMHHRSPASYLSGMFIGQEIKAVSDAIKNINNVILVGNQNLTPRYAAALDSKNIHSFSLDSNHAFLRGVSLLSRRCAL